MLHEAKTKNMDTSAGQDLEMGENEFKILV